MTAFTTLTARTGKHRFTATRATLRRDLADALADAEQAREARALAVWGREQAAHDLHALQGRYDELAAEHERVVAELAALKSKLLHDWYEEARAHTVDVRAPGDDPESAFFDGGTTQETGVLALWDALGTGLEEAGRAVGPVVDPDPDPEPEAEPEPAASRSEAAS